MPRGKLRRRRHYRITLQDAVNANLLAISMYGGLPGIKREADVLSAIGRPYSGYHRSIEAKAAALVQSVATNHGFNDGNKRCAYLLVTLLIERSGYKLAPSEEGEQISKVLEVLVLATVEDHLPFNDIAAWFRRRIRKA